MMWTLYIGTVGAAVVPEYAKWGLIAVKETQQRYQADIIDYLHVGRTYLSANKAEEKFKLWIRTKDGSEFGVYVYLQFNPAHDTEYTIRYERVG
ncbi:DUF3889 domain-containing protein [Paenibacillus lutimineralis]|nr:DUF3889 domain-containing protein [Paenibacillus lutimineralis]